MREGLLRKTAVKLNEFFAFISTGGEYGGNFLLLFHNARICRHPVKLMSSRFRSEQQKKYFFIQSVISLWNSLPQECDSNL